MQVSTATVVVALCGTAAAQRPATAREPTSPIAVAIVFQGGETPLCEDYDEPCGGYSVPGLAKAIDAAKLGTIGTLGPAGSQVVAISYANGAVVRLSLGPLDRLTGAALGDEAAYRGAIGTDLVVGIERGLAELTRATTPRRALIVIGDGNDIDNEGAAVHLPELSRQANADGIAMFGILYPTIISSNGNVLTSMIANAQVVGSDEGLAAQLAAIAAQLSSVTQVTLPPEPSVTLPPERPWPLGWLVAGFVVVGLVMAMVVVRWVHHHRTRARIPRP